MKLHEITLCDLGVDAVELNHPTHHLGLETLTHDRPGTYINPFKLFIARYHFIPNSIRHESINTQEALKWITTEHKENIKATHFNMRHMRNRVDVEYDDVYVFLYSDILIYFDMPESTIVLMFCKTELKVVECILSEIIKFKRKRKSLAPLISILVSGLNGLEKKYVVVSKSRLKLELNYNDDFLQVHKVIHKRLSKKNDKGLVLLHGLPGTGKTSYIRSLISSLRKEVIFLPPSLASQMTNPSFISVLVDNPNSILVIEDAENIIVDREHNGTSSVSTLLNIADGLLSDCLNIQIICTFNIDLAKVDNALLRKGRLIAKYEFKELAPTKANQLSEALGFSKRYQSAVTLSEVYNHTEEHFEYQTKRRIGFKSFDPIMEM